MSTNKKLRACLMCSFVASAAEFRKEGCPNCDDALEVRSLRPPTRPYTPSDHTQLTSALLPQMKGDQDRVLMCTTAQFDGVIAMIEPKESWVVRCSLSLPAPPSI